MRHVLFMVHVLDMANDLTVCLFLYFFLVPKYRVSNVVRKDMSAEFFVYKPRKQRFDIWMWYHI
jgi:hypothetical protein